MKLNRLSGALKIRDVDVDGLGLADAVQAADTLLQQIRVGRQIKQHQMMSELEVTTLAADFRTDQCVGALLRVCEIGRGAIALHQAKVFVKRSAADAGSQLQVVFQSHSGGGLGTDHHDFGGF